jgi:hypothetical protein
MEILPVARAACVSRYFWPDHPCDWNLFSFWR